jgi:integrase
MFAIATYLYARAGEVNALRWEDVDLERAIVHLHQSVDRELGT